MRFFKGIKTLKRQWKRFLQSFTYASYSDLFHELMSKHKVFSLFLTKQLLFKLKLTI